MLKVLNVAFLCASTFAIPEPPVGNYLPPSSNQLDSSYDSTTSFKPSQPSNQNRGVFSSYGPPTSGNSFSENQTGSSSTQADGFQSQYKNGPGQSYLPPSRPPSPQSSSYSSFLNNEGSDLRPPPVPGSGSPPPSFDSSTKGTNVQSSANQYYKNTPSIPQTPSAISNGKPKPSYSIPHSQSQPSSFSPSQQPSQNSQSPSQNSGSSFPTSGDSPSPSQSYGPSDQSQPAPSVFQGSQSSQTPSNSYGFPPSSSYGPSSQSNPSYSPSGPFQGSTQQQKKLTDPRKPSPSYGPPSYNSAQPKMGFGQQLSPSYGSPPQNNPSYVTPSSFQENNQQQTQLSDPRKPSSSYGPPSGNSGAQPKMGFGQQLSPSYGSPPQNNPSYVPPSSSQENSQQQTQLSDPRKPSSSYGPPSGNSGVQQKTGFGQQPNNPSFVPQSSSQQQQQTKLPDPRKPSSSYGPPSGNSEALQQTQNSINQPSPSYGPPSQSNPTYSPSGSSQGNNQQQMKPREPSSSYGPPSDNYGAQQKPVFGLQRSSYGSQSQNSPSSVPSSSSQGNRQQQTQFSRRPSSTYGPPPGNSETLQQKQNSMYQPSPSYGSPPKTPNAPTANYIPPPNAYGAPSMNNGQFSSQLNRQSSQNAQLPTSQPNGGSFPSNRQQQPASASQPSSAENGPPRRLEGQSGGPPIQGFQKESAGDMKENNNMPAMYDFRYQVSDQSYGTQFSQSESRNGDTAMGQYNVLLPDGRTQTVDYQADNTGFRSKVNYQKDGGSNYQQSFASTPKFVPNSEYSNAQQGSPNQSNKSGFSSNSGSTNVGSSVQSDFASTAAPRLLSSSGYPNAGSSGPNLETESATNGGHSSGGFGDQRDIPNQRNQYSSGYPTGSQPSFPSAGAPSGGPGTQSLPSQGQQSNYGSYSSLGPSSQSSRTQPVLSNSGQQDRATQAGVAKVETSINNSQQEYPRSGYSEQGFSSSSAFSSPPSSNLQQTQTEFKNGQQELSTSERHTPGSGDYSVQAQDETGYRY